MHLVLMGRYGYGDDSGEKADQTGHALKQIPLLFQKEDGGHASSPCAPGRSESPTPRAYEQKGLHDIDVNRDRPFVPYHIVQHGSAM